MDIGSTSLLFALTREPHPFDAEKNAVAEEESKARRAKCEAREAAARDFSSGRDTCPRRAAFGFFRLGAGRRPTRVERWSTIRF